MTAEQRHLERRTRLIEAAVELLGTIGATDTTVTAVCATSRVTTRYFYQHFADRDALLRAVFEQLNARLSEVLVAAVPPTSATAEGLALSPLRALVDTIKNDRKLARIVFIESATEPTLRQLRSEFQASLADLALQQTRLHLKLSDSAVGVAHLAATLGVGGLFEVFRRWLDGEIDYSEDALVLYCAGLLGSLGNYVLMQGTARTDDTSER